MEITQAEADVIRNPAPTAQDDIDLAKQELKDLDLASIRDIREWIASQADAPQLLKDKEVLAIATRLRAI